MENLQDVIRLGAKLDILYVEDDKMLLQETGAILRKIFRSVTTAGNGAEGLLKFTQNRYDLVITDIEMPELNGLEFSQKIKAINPQIPIVVISAYSNSTYLIEAINIGINHYIMKPILLPQLLSTLHSVVELIENRNMALEFRKQEIKESIRLANEKLFHAMTKATPNPVIVCDGRHVAFYNEAFAALFDKNALNELKDQPQGLSIFLERRISVDPLFQNDTELVQKPDVKQLQEGVPVKVSLKTIQGIRIYQMMKNTLHIEDGGEMVMFTFNDITALAFQRIQLSAYDRVIGKIAEIDYKRDSARKKVDIIDKTRFETES